MKNEDDLLKNKYEIQKKQFMQYGYYTEPVFTETKDTKKKLSNRKESIGKGLNQNFLKKMNLFDILYNAKMINN